MTQQERYPEEGASAMDSQLSEEPYNEQYYVEMFRRAIVQRDLPAREVVQQLFYEKVLCWMRAHPLREATAYFDNEENGVTQTFERFWQATAQTQKLEFSALTAILHYLWVILNGILLDRQRAYSLSQQVALKEPGRPGESHVDQSTDSVEAWQLLQRALPNVREQRLAYLLFHCGLGPREIALQCSQEFNDEHEIYQLRRNIMVRLMHLRLSPHDQDETLHRDRIL